MLVCLACPKQTHLPATHDDHHHHTTLVKSTSTALGPSKESIKSFTSQLKDIVMKFSSGAYRHCRPCTAAAVRGGVDEDNPILYEFDDEKSSILVGSNSEEQAMSDHHVHHKGMLQAEDESGTSCHLNGDAASPSSSHYDLLPIARCKQLRRHKKKGISMSSTSSSLTLKQLPCKPESCEAIEQLLNAHFLREERILAEERSCANRRDDEDLLAVDNRSDHQLLEAAELVCKERRIEERVEEEQREGVVGTVDGDVHVSSRSKRHGKGESSAGKFEEWVAQVEPGVIITFVALHDGSNHLKRIRFSRELFSKWQAQLWWAENCQMVRELYSVSKSVAPFKSCESARSSSSSTSSSSASSSFHRHGLRNTPELQSRVGSCESSPIQTPTAGINTGEKTTCSDPQASTSCVSHLSMSPSFGGFSYEMVDHHENPLYDGPKFEVCYNEGVSDSLMNQRDFGADDGGHSRESQDGREDVQRDFGADGGGHSRTSQDGREDVNPNASASSLLRELKRVKFIRQIPQSSN